MPRALFRRFVEIGRVALINFGPFEGRLCVIVDIIDHNRALVDGPSTITGVPRHEINYKRLSLTDFKLTIARGQRLPTLVKIFTAAKILHKWRISSWGKKLATRDKRKTLTDFGRFRIMLAKKKKSRMLRNEFIHLKKERNKSLQKVRAADVRRHKHANLVAAAAAKKKRGVELHAKQLAKSKAKKAGAKKGSEKPKKSPAEKKSKTSSKPKTTKTTA